MQMKLKFYTFILSIGLLLCFCSCNTTTVNSDTFGTSSELLESFCSNDSTTSSRTENESEQTSILQSVHENTVDNAQDAFKDDDQESPQTNRTEQSSPQTSEVASNKNTISSTVADTSSKNNTIGIEQIDITYTVEYDANGGWGNTNNSVHLYNQPRSLSKNGFKRAGYTFLGWDFTPASTNPKFSDTQIVDNLTKTDNATIKLYAIWRISQTSTFDDCKRALVGKKEVYYNTSATDNLGNEHTGAAIFMNRDSSPSEKRYDERYTNGLFSKIRGVLYLGGEYTINSYTNIQLIIKADGNIVFKSKFFTKYSESQSFEADISGANIVEIYVADPVSDHIGAWNRGGDIIIDGLTLVR